jgi:UDP-N-acetylmuramyl tripeptide synthase
VSGAVVRREADRRRAIAAAIEFASPGDVVVIAGKGHETYQEIAGQRIPFNDAEEARHALSVHFPSDPSSWLPAPSDGVPAEDH